MSHGPHLVIEIRLPRWSLRRWLAVGLALTTLAAAVAWAGVMWTPFAAGEKLTSAKMNANFQAMANAIDAINAKPAGLQPHLILNQGNVDLGIYVGQGFVYSPAVKAPMNILDPPLQYLYFDGNNCTGNAYYANGQAPWYWNVALNTILGTIYVPTGPPQKNVTGASQSANGVCANQNWGPFGAIPVNDSKVPNNAVPDVTQVSIQMM